MKLKIAVVALAVPALLVGGAVQSSARGADHVMGKGFRGPVEFEFFAVLTPSGNVVGRFHINFPGFGVSEGKVNCGWINGNQAVIGGISGSGEAVTLNMTDDPDGIIFGSADMPCDISGHGWPGSLPLTSGDIQIIDR
jgi:hypothetical protein